MQRVRTGVAAARECPGDPRVDGAETEVAALGPGPLGVDLVEDGHHLGGGRVGRQANALGLQDEAGADGPQVLPSDAGRDRPARRPLPDNAGRPLVGDPDRRNGAACSQRVAGDRERGLGHPRRVELDQPRRRGVREDRRVVDMLDRGVGAHDGRPHARGADVDDEDAPAAPAHGQGTGPNGEGRPSLPGLRMPAGSSACFSAASTSKPCPSAAGRKRARCSPMPWWWLMAAPRVSVASMMVSQAWR